MEQKISMGSPENRGFVQKTFNFTLRDISLTYFWSFLKPIQYFAKMLRYWVTVQISKSDGLPRSSNKRKTVRSPSWNKGFQWEARKTMDLSKKLLISLCEIFFSHIFPAFWNLWNVLRKCLDIDLLYRSLSMMVFHGLLTRGRPLEARNETKDFNGKPGRPWIWRKTFKFTLRDIFLPYFSNFLKPIQDFAKMLRYWVTVQISKSDCFPRSSNKKKTVRSPSWNKGFQWEARKTVDLSKKLLISLCEIFFSHIFRAFWNLWNVLRKCLDIELLYRYRSLTFSNGLLTKGRPLEALHETKDFNGKPGRPFIWGKKLSISLREIFFSHIFRPLWNLWNVLRKCLDIELLYRYPSLTVFHGLLTKGRMLEARHEVKDFNGKPGRPWIWAKNC